MFSKKHYVLLVICVVITVNYCKSSMYIGFRTLNKEYYYTIREKYREKKTEWQPFLVVDCLYIRLEFSYVAKFWKG